MLSLVSKQRSKSGFTLIELLVVIAIIAILAAILMPVFVEVRKTALRVSCMTQMKQIWQAASKYADDRNGKLPPATYNIGGATPDNPRDAELWPAMIEAYFKKQRPSFWQSDSHMAWRLLRCPADKIDPMDRPENGNRGVYRPGSEYYWFYNWSVCASPGYNYAYLSPFSAQTGDAMPVYTSSAARPAQTVMFADSCPLWAESGESYGYFLISAPLAGQIPDTVTYGNWRKDATFPAMETGWVYGRHRGAANVIWLDGHASVMRPKDLADNDLWDLR